MKILFTILSIIGLSAANYAQTNSCGSPTVLTVNTKCTTQAFAVNQNNSNQEIDASCATLGIAYSDAWYTVAGTGNSMTITVSGTNTGYALAAFTSCAAGELDCDLRNTGVTGSITFATANGTTYYIQIQRRSGSSNDNLSGNICAVSAGSGGGSLSIDNGDQTLCTGKFTDAGGSGGAYSNNENFTATYCSDNGQAINFTFTSFDTESFDRLLIYNGTDASAPLLLDVNGHSVTTPFIISSANVSNCLTFVFTSDGSLTYDGWLASISCGIIVGTCSDGLMNQDETGIDCGGLTCPACPTIGACGNLTTNDFCSDPGTLTQGTGNWNNTTTGSYTADTPANLTTPFCGSIENNSWYKFTAIATTETFVFSAVGGTSCGS
tara:strand:+ start:913 stop:2052 length:1140 start_codon:yes stop_codon:yes gene_type:complete